MYTLGVKHNIEVAHRLSQLEGKCQNIHGHSMLVTLSFHGGQLDEFGVYEGMPFKEIKNAFRHHLDSQYDHHLLLNENDPWAHATDLGGKPCSLPGLMKCAADPTTENLATWIQQWAKLEFGMEKTIEIELWETAVNSASVIS